MSLCANALENYINADCEETFAGGIRSIIIFQDELPEDPSNESQVQALLDSGSAKLLTSLKCGVAEPSPITSPSMRSCSPERTINYDRTMSLIDANVVSGNIDFYNSLNNATGFEAEGMLLHHCDVDRCSFVDEPIAFEGGLIIPDDNIDQPQHWSFTAKWKSKGDAAIVASPGSIFG
jgi:hypothetical protein